MEVPRSYEAFLVRDKPGRRIQWPEGHSRATHSPTHEGQLPEKDTRVTARGSLVAEVLGSGG